MDLAGCKFGGWIVLRRAEDRHLAYWWCRCICGTRRRVEQGSLVHGRSTSCGCLRQPHKTHGEGSKATETPEHRTWHAMKDRCENPGNGSWIRYGGRGITIGTRWSKSYVAFLSDVGRRPASGYSLGRIDNDRGYESGNVEWQTPRQQNRNSKNNRIVVIDGVAHPVSVWCELRSLNARTVYQRLYRGWDTQRALEVPC